MLAGFDSSEVFEASKTFELDTQSPPEILLESPHQEASKKASESTRWKQQRMDPEAPKHAEMYFHNVSLSRSRGASASLQVLPPWPRVCASVSPNNKREGDLTRLRTDLPQPIATYRS